MEKMVYIDGWSRMKTPCINVHFLFNLIFLHMQQLEIFFLSYVIKSIFDNDFLKIFIVFLILKIIFFLLIIVLKDSYIKI